MKIALVQFSPLLNAKEENIKKLVQVINNTDSQIVVFPELALTGYFFLSRDEVRIVADSFKSDTILLFQEMASKQNKTIIFGFAEAEKDKLYNSAAILLPNPGKSKVYRKTHLFYKERFCFDEGNSGFFVINDESHNINIGTMICYDWRFPEAARSLGLLGADLIACPSNLVTSVWHIAMPARALENKLYLAVANRTGSEVRNNEELIFKGESALWDYNGSLLCKAEPDGDTVMISDIEPEKTRDKSFNPFNDIYKDRRPDMYIS